MGANMNLCDCAGWTPLHVATYNGRAYVCYILLENGADSSIETRQGKCQWSSDPINENDKIRKIL